MSGDEIRVVVESYLEDLIPRYLENRRADVEAIGKAVEEGDLESARAIGHQMKGSGGGYGFPELTEIGFAIESAAKAGESGTVGELNHRLADYLSRLVIEYE